MLDVKDRIPAIGKAGRKKITYENGHEEYATIEMADEPIEAGTPINRALFESIRADLESLREYAYKLTPAGTLMYFAGGTAPNGWLVCDGSAVSRTTYADLFAAIGTTYGAGDGSTTFKLPDLRGVFLRGLDSGRGLDPGRALGTYQVDEFAEHSHTYLLHQNGSEQGAGIGSYFGLVRDRMTLDSGNAGGTETRPKNIAVLPCIKF